MTDGLRIAELNAGYTGHRVLSRLALPDIPPGSLVALVGPNAVGKSTLLRALAGLVSARGSVHLDGADLLALPLSDRVRQIGYLPQTLPQGNSLVAYEAVMSALRAVRPDLSGIQVRDALDIVFHTLGLEDLALRRLAEMSGGQRQMVGLAQAMVRRPRLLLLDEPTSALDLRWQLRVLATVREIGRQEGMICLLATHDLNQALRFCDQIVALRDGGVLAAGPPDEAISPDILRETFGIEGRIEQCSRGFPIAIADAALAGPTDGALHRQAWGER